MDKISNQFEVMTDYENLTVDGGFLPVLMPVISNAAVAIIIYKDLSNCYHNGYNEVMSSAGKKGKK